MATEAHNEAVEAVTDKIFGASEEAPDEVVEAPPEEIEAAPEAVDEEVEAPDEVTDDGPQMFEVQIGDHVYDVPEEIKAEIDKAQDYTSKTQAASAERKTIEAQKAIVEQEAQEQAFLREVTPDVTDLQMKQAQVKQWQDHKRQNIDSLTYQDIFKIDAQIDELKEGVEAIKQSVTIRWNEHQQAQEQAHKDLLAKSTEALKSRIPNWSDDHKAQARDIGLKAGFSEAELDQAADPREWEILWKAAQYDRLQAGKATAIQKVQSAPTIKPKARRSDAQQAVTNRLNTRKAIKNAKGNKAKADLIKDDLASRLGL